MLEFQFPKHLKGLGDRFIEFSAIIKEILAGRDGSYVKLTLKLLN